MKIFQQRLKEQRELYGYTIRYMAEQLNMHHTSYLNYEQGKAEPTQENLIKLADIFDVTVDYLLGRKNDL